MIDTLRRRAWPKLVGLSNEVDLVAELDGTPKAATLDKRGSPTADHELRRVRRRVEQQRQHLLIPEYKENEFQPAGGPRAPADDDAASTSSAQATGYVCVVLLLVALQSVVDVWITHSWLYYYFLNR